MALTYVSKKLGEPKHKLKLGITIVWCLTSYMFNHAFNQFVPIVFSSSVYFGWKNDSKIISPHFAES